MDKAGDQHRRILSEYLELSEEEPVSIDCNLRGWTISNAEMKCNTTNEMLHWTMENVLELSSKGAW